MNILKSKEFAYILGTINIGDGWISYNPIQKRYNIGLVSIDYELIEYFSLCCLKIFDKSPNIYLKKSTNANWKDRYSAYLCSKHIVEFFLELAPLEYYRDQTSQIVPCVFDFSLELKASYLQAFFDGQGSVLTKNNIITGAKKRQTTLIDIQKILDSMSIKSSVKKNAVVICNKNIPKYKELIGFQCQRKLDKLNQIPEPFYQREFTDHEVNQIINLYYKNVAWRQIAKYLKCSKGAIQYRIEKHCKNSPL